MIDAKQIFNLVKSTVVNFTKPKSYQEFIVADADVKTTSNIMAQLARRADTFDNCGDDMDCINITCKPGAGTVTICIAHQMPNQLLFGTFKINYQNN